jgi:AAA family ATP:ADP antiporter
VSPGSETRPSGRITRTLQRFFDVRDHEVRALLLSAAYFFCMLLAYYVLRPIRDEAAVAGGVRNLPWMFTGTLVLMLLVNPPFAALVVRFSRVRFVSITYRFFMLNLVVFFFLLRATTGGDEIWVGRAFYWWLSVFNLFVVSIFWAFMADVFRTEQSKRLFGFIAVGGTLGAATGSTITGVLAQFTSPAYLMLVSVVLLEIGVRIVKALSRHFESLPRAKDLDGSQEEPIGGSVWAGFAHVVRSPYLLGICLYILAYTIVGTVLYFQQAEIAATIEDRGDRTSFFAFVDSATNWITLFIQLFLTGRIIKWLGVAVTLTLLPALCIVGFTVLGFWPSAIAIVVFQTLRRAANFAVARPTRETLYTVVSREDKYKAKALIDTFVYRGGDQIGAWSYAGLGALGLGIAGIAFATVPIAGLWLLIGYWLGRRQTEMVSQAAGLDPSGSPAPAA